MFLFERLRTDGENGAVPHSRRAIGVSGAGIDAAQG